MLARWIIIDGNNLLHADPARNAIVHRDFALARASLVRQMESLVGILAERITIVFDGATDGRQTSLASAGVDVLFSSLNASADSIIERLSAESPDPESLVVISSDRQEREIVEAAGIHTLPCRLFLVEVRRAADHLAATMRKRSGSPEPRGKLGDFFPDAR